LRPTPSSAGSAQVPNWSASAWGQGAQSTKSFQAATAMFGWFASIATAGSFWWFCGVVSGGLPTLTSPASAGAATHNAQTRVALRRRLLLFIRNLPSARREIARRKLSVDTTSRLEGEDETTPDRLSIPLPLRVRPTATAA